MRKAKIAIIDYDAGNLYSVLHACNFVGLDAEISSDPKVLASADGAILPGVGAFGEAMNNLKKLKLVEPIKEFITSGKAFMGICLGFQLLFSESEEFGHFKGLDIVSGKVVRFPNDNKGKLIRVPQIGWNAIGAKDKKVWQNSYLKNVKEGAFMYFVHSYYCVPKDKKDVLSLTNYEGIEYASAIKKGNLYAFQFHPEKSGKEGIKIYQEFAKEVKKQFSP